MVGGWGGVVVDLHSHFCVQPDNCVEVVLRCVVVGVVTTFGTLKEFGVELW